MGLFYIKNVKENTIIYLVLALIYLLVSLPVSFAVQISYQYDANGNLIQDESSYYEYNGFDQLVRVRLGNSSGTILSDYFYDHEGNRILTIDYNGPANTSTFYPSDSFVQVVNQTGTYNTTYYYAGNVLLAADNGSIAYYHSDHLGSTTLVTDSAGALLRETKYGPFGAILSGGNDRYLYTGQEFDGETGLYYYGARFYKPEYYHFTQPDKVIVNVYDPQSLNRYAYVRNNPYKYVDKDGNVAFLAPILIGGGIGAVAGLTTYFLTHDDYTVKGALAYAAGGAVAGGAGVVSVGYAIAGGIASTLITNYADNKKTTVGDLVVNSAISATGFKLGKALLPYAPKHLIKNPLSYLTTKTGQKFIANEVTEQFASELGETAGTSLGNYQQNKQKTTKTSTTTSSSSKSYENLNSLAKNNPNKTAAELIKEWRAKS